MTSKLKTQKDLKITLNNIVQDVVTNGLFATRGADILLLGTTRVELKLWLQINFSIFCYA